MRLAEAWSAPIKPADFRRAAHGLHSTGLIITDPIPHPLYRLVIDDAPDQAASSISDRGFPPSSNMTLPG
jgi:hypothetical protein